MKNVAYSIFIFLISINSYALECQKEKDWAKYFFLNGVGNNPKSIKESMRALTENLNLDQVENLLNPKNDGPMEELILGRFNFLPTFGELRETFSQKTQESLQDKGTIVDQETVTRHFKQLSNTQHNVVFAHSQGNLYANSLCKLNNNRKKQITLGIATPASEIDCGSKYVTLEDDAVINELRNITKYSLGKMKSPLPSNAKLKINEICISNDILCHSLSEIYLLHETPLNIIKKYFSNIKEEIRKEHNVQFASIQLKELKQEDKGYLQTAVDNFGNVKSSVGNSVRRTIASVKTIGYLSDVANSGFISSLMKFSTNKLTKKEFNKLLDTEIKVDSDEDLADVVGYVFDTVKGYCLSYPKFVPSQISAYCKMSKDFYYFNPSEFNDAKGFDSYSLISSKMKWNGSSKTLSMSCEEVQGLENKDISIDLSYAPEYSKIVSLQISDFNYDVYPRNLLNQKTNRAPAATMSISLSNEGVYGYAIKQISNKINYVELVEGTSNYRSCNSISKLLANNCKDYLLKLLSRSR